jgi:alanyl-tRNA synthetase
MALSHKKIRSLFFDFFASRRHEVVPSSSIIPAGDPTILFTNAGMNQFKDLFLGREKRSYKCAVTIQKCVRAGGKHNDLDNVGFTDRHLTFFEMLGNFSFGDYFKKDAIEYAWRFLTESVQIEAEKLRVSVHKSDDESFELWKKIARLPETRITRMGDETNFWQMGDFGPCGPCTEIFYDRGPSFGCVDLTTCKGPACECTRFLEIWNLVFMQFDRQVDGKLQPLEAPGVDTGMGLERLCLVLQGADSVYGTDLFAPILKKIEFLSQIKYATADRLKKAAFHVLADHIRSAVFIITDGGLPANEGRGYVLRKIIRRAVLFSQKLSTEQIFPSLATAVIDEFGGLYPELKERQNHIEQILKSETEKFSVNVLRGTEILERYFAESKEKLISGTQAFKLYDTYGFPLELVVAASRERNFEVDTATFEKLMETQRAQSGKKEADQLDALRPGVKTEFTGYETLHTKSTVAALVYENRLVKAVDAGAECYVIPQQSPFFIVGGGQVPDEGTIEVHGKHVPLKEVRYIDTGIAIRVIAPVAIRIGDPITQQVDELRRKNAMKNHTGTHLLQAALIQHFGVAVKQAGSLVHPDYLRFDFTFHGAINDEDLGAVEQIVNDKVQSDIPVDVKYMPIEQAATEGALAFFGEKYATPERVRVIMIDDFSRELCGGTHVQRTGQIGFFKITELLSPAAGQKRIHALTGPKAVQLAQQNFSTVKQLAQEFKVKREEVLPTVLKQKLQLKQLQQELELKQSKLIRSMIPTLVNRVRSIKTVPFGCFEFEQFSLEDLRTAAQQFLAEKPGLYCLLSKQEDKTLFYMRCAPEFESRISYPIVQEKLVAQCKFRGGKTKEGIQGSVQSTCEYIQKVFEESL